MVERLQALASAVGTVSNRWGLPQGTPSPESSEVKQVALRERGGAETVAPFGGGAGVAEDLVTGVAPEPASRNWTIAKIMPGIATTTASSTATFTTTAVAGLLFSLMIQPFLRLLAAAGAWPPTGGDGKGGADGGLPRPPPGLFVTGA